MTTATLLVLVLCASTVVAVAIVSILAVRSTKAQARHAEEALESYRAEAAELRARVDALTVAATVPSAEEYVITDLGEPHQPEQQPVAERIDGKLFIDIVARESVVKAAAFGHGLKTVLSPVNRNRIRFEMKREVKRRRKERRTIVRSLRREAALRQRMAQEPSISRDSRIPGAPRGRPTGETA